MNKGVFFATKSIGLGKRPLNKRDKKKTLKQNPFTWRLSDLELCSEYKPLPPQ